MTSNTDRLLKLKQLIYDSLDPLIDRDYCLLDIPDHPNIGDQLIYEGELDFLKRFKHKMIYESNEKFEDLNKIPEGCLILLHGGGNFGYIGPSHQDFRKKIIQRFPKNRIIIFPQTVFYKKPENIPIDAEIFNQHPDLTVCVRDQYSYDLLKQHSFKNNILLLPDMAFCLDLSRHISSTKTNKTLVLKRKDRELHGSFNIDHIKQLISENQKIDVKDWPTMDNTQPKFKLLSLVNFLNRHISKKFAASPSLRPLLNSKYGLLRGNFYSKWYINEGIKYMNQYDEVFTTRLHGYILSVLLNKKAFMIDNSYGKNSNFYKTWMTEFDNSQYLQL